MPYLVQYESVCVCVCVCVCVAYAYGPTRSHLHTHRSLEFPLYNSPATMLYQQFNMQVEVLGDGFWLSIKKRNEIFLTVGTSQNRNRLQQARSNEHLITGSFQRPSCWLLVGDVTEPTRLHFAPLKSSPEQGRVKRI